MPEKAWKYEGFDRINDIPYLIHGNIFNKENDIYFYFHDNGSTILDNRNLLDSLNSTHNKTFISIEYPGYYQETPFHEESSFKNYRDMTSVREIIEIIADCVEKLQKLYQIEKFSFMGRSIGTLVSCQLCNYFVPERLVLITPIAGISKDFFESTLFGPVMSFVSIFTDIKIEKLDNVEAASRCKDVVLVYAKRDEILSYKHIEVFQKRIPWSQIKEVDATHNSIDISKISDFLFGTVVSQR